MTGDAAAPTTVVHRPGGGAGDVRATLAEAWRRRAFAWHLARTRAEAERYATVFGQLWTLLNPLLLAGVYLVLITVLTGSGGRDRLLLVVLGLFWFALIRLCAVHGARAVSEHAGLVLNVAFPRVLLVVAAVLTALRAMVPSLLVYAVLHLALGGGVHLTWLLVVPLLAITALLGVGVAALLAVATLRFRDLATALPYGLRILLYLTPVLYRPAEIPAALEPWLRLNPLRPVFAALQSAVLDGRAAWAELLVATLVALVVAAVGTAVFLRAERSFGVHL